LNGSHNRTLPQLTGIARLCNYISIKYMQVAFTSNSTIQDDDDDDDDDDVNDDIIYRDEYLHTDI